MDYTLSVIVDSAQPGRYPLLQVSGDVPVLVLSYLVSADERLLLVNDQAVPVASSFNVRCHLQNDWAHVTVGDTVIRVPIAAYPCYVWRLGGTNDQGNMARIRLNDSCYVVYTLI